MHLVRVFSIILSFIFTSCAGATVFYNPQTGEKLPLKEAVKTLEASGIYVLGETHYVQEIQEAQGEFIKSFVKEHGLQEDFNVAWEFLDFPRQSIIEAEFEKWSQGLVSFDAMMKEAFGRNPGDNILYRPLFDAAKIYGGKIIATNAPREWKRKIVSDGFQALNADETPRGLRRGNDAYLERFIAAMGGHGDPATFENYFLAQSYTDAVMADQIEKNHTSTSFMIVGHFHSDFGHGLPEYLRDLGAVKPVLIRMIDASGLSDSELTDALKPHVKYGEVADYFIIVGE